MINLYLQDKVPGIATSRKAAARCLRLVDYFSGMRLDEVTGSACRQFAKARGAGAARRELQDLQAAINYHHREGLHRETVTVTLPPAGNARQRWLTRDEVAKLLWVCWRTKHDGNNSAPLRHVARFVLFGVYTGSRPGDCLGASFRLGGRGGYVDTGSGLYFRKPDGKTETKKRQPTTPIPDRLLAHLRRWECRGARSVVEFGGEPIGSVKTAMGRLTKAAGLSDVVPYTLRHTAATWMVQRGVPIWEVAGYLGTSPAMIERHYGHHAPEHLRQAANAVTARTLRGRNGTKQA